MVAWSVANRVGRSTTSLRWPRRISRNANTKKEFSLYIAVEC
jgi:hypothetical protein